MASVYEDWSDDRGGVEDVSIVRWWPDFLISRANRHTLRGRTFFEIRSVIPRSTTARRGERDLFIITCGVCRVEFDGRPRKKVFFHRDLSARVSSRRSYVTGVAFVPLLAPSSTIGASNGLNFDKFRTCEKKCSCNIDIREVNVEYRPPCKCPCFEVFFFFASLMITRHEFHSSCFASMRLQNSRWRYLMIK